LNKNEKARYAKKFLLKTVYLNYGTRSCLVLKRMTVQRLNGT
jgi:hypothetical protein